MPTKTQVDHAIEKLGIQFTQYDWIYGEYPGTGGRELTFNWYGGADEDVMVCVHNGRELAEKFHRHGFFFFNYAYRGSYQALSQAPDNLITVHEGQMYVGQPFNGYALRGNAEQPIVIVGVLVRAEAFYREFLPLIGADQGLLRFFLGPRQNRFSQEYRQVDMGRGSGVRGLLELMMVEYANRQPDSQQVLKPLAVALASLVARAWRTDNPTADDDSPVQRVVDAIAQHLDHVSLGELADQLGYHPNYLSTLVRQQRVAVSPSWCVSSAWNVPTCCWSAPRCRWRRWRMRWATRPRVTSTVRTRSWFGHSPRAART